MSYVVHIQCAQHIYANFRKNFNDETHRNMFWRSCMSTTEEGFKSNMEELRKFSQEAYDHLIRRVPNTWSTCLAYSLKFIVMPQISPQEYSQQLRFCKIG